MPRRGEKFAMAMLALVALPQEVSAAAWTRPEGEWQVITNTVFYTTDTYVSPKGRQSRTPRFTKWELNPYAEYGLNDSTTLGFSAFLQALSQDAAAGGKFTNSGAGDVELFLRRKLWEENGFVFSLQPSLKLPARTESDSFPEIASSQTDVELRALGGYSFALGGYYHFVNAEAAYRTRMENPKDQVRLNLAAGFRVGERLMLLPEASAIFSTDLPSASTNAIRGAADYHLAKLQFSGVFTLTERTSLQCGVFADTYARNTGKGGGLLLSLWHRF